MRKFGILMVVALIAASCSVGTYYPYAQNNFGAQSKVVLKKANFRVVRDVEAIVDINNTNLSRADVANSAYGELLRKAQLTGSQVLINVVIEEVRRESAGFFRLLFGMPKRVQHVAARATIIEFLDENGNPTVSQTYRPAYTRPMASVDDIQKCEQTHKEIYKKIYEARANLNLKYNKIYNLYKNIYNSSQLINENIVYITKIQTVLMNYINTQGKAYPTLEYQLMNAASMEDAIQIFLSYYQE